MVNTNYLTKEGLEKLNTELEYLKKIKRKEVAERLRTAASFGDLSENFDYANAREEQEFVERRIRELEDLLMHAEVVASKDDSGKVQIGSRVVLRGEGKPLELQIAGTREADPLNGKISLESPFGSALIGKKAGESVEIETPNGKVMYKIAQVK
ncbi:MAG: transcription elongation factor GreA [Parcubacteria group bacterium]|nr:transcription elongation factor GreA [Parcubacteria group bacterium]